MISPKDLFDELIGRGFDFFAGVPDSLLKDFCAYVDDMGADGKHIITANEGSAVAMAIGHHLGTGKAGVVYMQNSGLGNTINPLVSLADPEVYKVPMLLVIGWRGEPGVSDEPQHVKQGRVTPAILESLEIPYFILDSTSSVKDVVSSLHQKVELTNAPVALVVKSKTFEKYRSQTTRKTASSMTREQAIESIVEKADKDDLFISTTGKTSRELFEIRAKNGQECSDFLTVGGMGHTSSIALGVALSLPDRRIICLDGDGSFLMHMGSAAIVGSLDVGNFLHVVLNNSAHESVGGQATVASDMDLESLAKSVGYNAYQSARNASELGAAWDAIRDLSGPVLLEVEIAVGSRDDLGRPTSSPVQNKDAFMRKANADAHKQ